VTAPSACPGTIQTGARSALPPAAISTISSLTTPRRRAIAGPISAALSQVRRVIGLGSSCSQPLLANAPSATFGSGRNSTAIPVSGATAAGRSACRPSAMISSTGRGRPGSSIGIALPATNPSCSARRQAVSKSPPIRPRQKARTMSWPDGSVSPASAATTSSALRPP
jgi:hypothetical protein